MAMGFLRYNIQTVKNQLLIITCIIPQLASSSAGNAIHTIFEDDDSNMWIGTAWNGISVLDKKNQTEIILSDFYWNKSKSCFIHFSK